MIVVVRRVTIVVLALVGSLAYASTGAGSRSGEPVFSAGDLRVLVRTRPPKPVQLKFVVGDPYVGTGPTFSLHDYLEYTGSHAQIGRLKKDGFRVGGHTRWDPEGTFGNLYAAVVFGFLFRDASGARTWFGDLRSTVNDPSSTAVPHAELGPNSVGRHGRGQGEEAAIFLWRRGNLDLIAVMNCEGPCGFDVAGATRAYADAIDGSAKRAA
jgi:hypothetical protein